MSNINQKIFEQLLKVVPIVNTDKPNGKSVSNGFMDLNYDLVFTGEGNISKHFALSHYYKHDSGDMIPDPDMTMTINFQEKKVFPRSYQDMYRYDEVDGDSFDSLKDSLNDFLLMWLQNLESQGHIIQ